MKLQNQIEALLTDDFLNEIIEIRRHLHQDPEISFEEHRTSAFIRELLNQWGIEYKYPIVKTGILAWITGNNPGNVLHSVQIWMHSP